MDSLKKLLSPPPVPHPDKSVWGVWDRRNELQKLLQAEFGKPFGHIMDGVSVSAWCKAQVCLYRDKDNQWAKLWITEPNLLQRVGKALSAMPRWYRVHLRSKRFYPIMSLRYCEIAFDAPIANNLSDNELTALIGACKFSIMPRLFCIKDANSITTARRETHDGNWDGPTTLYQNGIVNTVADYTKELEKQWYLRFELRLRRNYLRRVLKVMKLMYPRPENITDAIKILPFSMFFTQHYFNEEQFNSDVRRAIAEKKHQKLLQMRCDFRLGECKTAKQMQRAALDIARHILKHPPLTADVRQGNYYE